MPAMKHLAAATSLLAAVASAFPSPYRPSYNTRSTNSTRKALYFLQNNETEASIIAMNLQNGQVSNPTRYSTAGAGLSIVNATTDAAIDIDQLQSQGSVAVGGNYLFTVNAGSNTIAWFDINPEDPTQLTQVGPPTSTLGDFPQSIAYDKTLQKVCVLNGGYHSNVACFNIKGRTLESDGEPRDLNLQQTTPPVAGSGTGSQISFHPNHDSVYVSAKGNAAPTIPGTIYVYPIEDGEVSQDARNTSVTDIPDPFGFVFGPEPSQLLVSAESFGGSVVRFSENQGEEMQHDNSTLKLSCWAVYCDVTHLGYVIDAVTPQLGVFNMTTGELLYQQHTDDIFEGAFDAVVDGSVMWFIAMTSAVGGFDLAGNKTVQNFDLTNTPGVDDRSTWMGMALWEPSY